MKKIIKLFDTCLFFRTISVFLLVVLIFSCLLILEKSIPNQRVKSNILKSEDYYQEYFKELYGNLNTLKDRHTMIDIPGDFYHLSILYLEDYKHPIQGFIEMNKDSELSQKVIRGGHFTDIEMDSDYSRYWNGHLIILKPLLTFFTIDTIFIIYFILLIIVFFVLLMNLLKHSKLLAFIFSIGSVSINIFFASKCDNFFHVMMISMILSIIIIKLYEKNHTKYIDLLFLVGGMVTAYMDMLSCGTLPVTLPLFIYVYLHILDQKRFPFKKLIQYILLWLLGGIMTYVAKWILLLIHYQGGFREHVLEPMKVRIGSGDMGRIEMFKDSLSKIPHYLFPYDCYWLTYLLMGFGFLSFILLLKNKKNRMNYISLFMITLIPFIRYLFLAEHSNYHNYFTYRCFLPVIMFLLLCFISMILNIGNYLSKKRE